MAKFCGKCGTPLNDTAVFCGGCGSPVPAGQPAPAVQSVAAVPPTPAYTPAPAFTPVEASTPAPAFTPVTAAPVQPAPAYTPAPALTPVEASTPAPAFTPVTAAPVQPAPAYTPAPAFTPVAASTPAPAFTPAPTFAATPTYTPVAAYVPGAPVPPAKKSNTLLKVIIAFVVLLFVGTALAVGGMWYAAQKIKEKAAAAARENPGLASVMGAVGGLAKSVASSSDASSSDASSNDDPMAFKGDPCRFLSTQEVSQAVGVPIIRAEGENGSCSYIAKGDPADMTAKHMTAMTGELAGPGLDDKSKKMVEQFAGGLFHSQEAQDKDLSAAAAKGEVPVLGIMLTTGNAEAQMKLNRAGFNYITGPGGGASSKGTGDLDGIGDEAYLAGGSMLIVRKGETIGRFMYTACPCNTGNIKPLAKLAASRM